MGFNDIATKVSYKARKTSKVAGVSAFPQTQVSIDRGNQTRRQKRLKVSLPTFKTLEEPK